MDPTNQTQTETADCTRCEGVGYDPIKPAPPSPEPPPTCAGCGEFCASCSEEAESKARRHVPHFLCRDCGGSGRAMTPDQLELYWRECVADDRERMRREGASYRPLAKLAPSDAAARALGLTVPEARCSVIGEIPEAPAGLDEPADDAEEQAFEESLRKSCIECGEQHLAASADEVTT